MAKVLVVATSRKTRGGITSVIKAHQTGKQWKNFHCHWIQTHRDGAKWRKISYLLVAWVDYLMRLPFYDIVHLHFSLQTTARRKVPFAKLAKMMGKKVVIHLHCGSQIHDIWNSNYDFLFNNADISILLSESLKGMVEEHSSKENDYRVVYNPCPTVNKEPILVRKKEILFSGTICEGKGYKDLIKAFSMIAPSHPDWKVVLAGNGEIEQGKAFATELGISNQVVFLGWISGNAKDIAFRECSVFCLPSYAEGFPMAVLDAWAYSVPVISTPVGGIPDVAQDGENMLLFNPGDIDMLSKQLDRIISDDKLRVKIERGSRELASTTFNINTINAQLGAIYDELARK